MINAKENMIAEIINSIRRGEANSLDAYLRTVEHAIELVETQTKFYAHMIQLDGNGGVRLKDFIEFIARHIIEYVIPRNKILEADEKDKKSKMHTHLMRLQSDAAKLFTPLKKTGEGGEMLLFILGEVLLGLPQLFCKMSVKTSGGVHYHGADGVHAGVSQDGKLELYWGESKLHKNYSGALDDCVASISPILKRENNANHEDLLLLANHLNLAEQTYTEAIKNILNKDNSEFNSVTYCGLCLIGFDKDLYAKETSSEAIDEQCKKWKEDIAAKLKDKGLSEFKIHFFCLPFVSVQAFRDEFLRVMGLSDEQVAEVTKKNAADE